MRKAAFRPDRGGQLSPRTECGILFASVSEQCMLPGTWCLMLSLSGAKPQTGAGPVKKNRATA